jgi:hypothetical protein
MHSDPGLGIQEIRNKASPWPEKIISISSVIPKNPSSAVVKFILNYLKTKRHMTLVDVALLLKIKFRK